MPNERRISGFWRRIAAYAIDLALLGVAGSIVGSLCFDPLAHLGGLGRFVGLGIAVAYFGFFNSTLAGGQTPGKRVMGLQVIDAEGREIGLGRSLLRATILEVPLFLNGFEVPSRLAASPVLAVVVFLAAGLGGAIAYLYLFNRKTRQSLHDLAVGSYVVTYEPAGPFRPMKLWLGHWVVSALWGGLLLIGFLVGSQLTRFGPFPTMLATIQKIEALPDVRHATLTMGTNWNSLNGISQTTHSFTSVVRMKRRPIDDEAAAAHVAAVILQNEPAGRRQDFIAIDVIYGFDLGIAHWTLSQSISHTPQQWRAILDRAI